MAELLRLTDLSVAYDVIAVLKGISISVHAGEIVTLIGANGAGKSTTLRTICGLVHPKQGKVFFDGEDISAFPPHVITQKGISQAPEGRGIFANLSVEDNLEIGAYHQKDRKLINKDKNKIFEIFPILRERRKQEGGTLSGGEQQMLTIGRALMAHPKLLLLDEPSLGLAPQVMAQIFKVIQTINQEGTTILLVEQNANKALHIAHRAYVLETGRIVLEGTARDLLGHPDVKKAYLGE